MVEQVEHGSLFLSYTYNHTNNLKTLTMRHSLIYISAFFLLVVSCVQINNKTAKAMGIDSSEGIKTNSPVTSLPTADTTYIVFQSDNTKQINLSNDEIKLVNTLISDCINNYNPEQEKKFNKIKSEHPEYPREKDQFVILLEHYKRQYMPSVNEKGEKIVFVNCFCGNWDENSRKNFKLVDDGGNCYFNLKINLTTKKYFNFMVNGEA